MSSESGHLDVAQVLLGARANIEATIRNGRMPLHVASYKGHVDVIQVLINAKADLQA